MRPVNVIPLPLLEDTRRRQGIDASGGSCCSCLALAIIILAVALGAIYSLANP